MRTNLKLQMENGGVIALNIDCLNSRSAPSHKVVGSDVGLEFVQKQKNYTISTFGVISLLPESDLTPE